jgi:class 3 adenylate cyclase
MERPDTRRTWSGDFSIAYQVVGSGRADLVYLPQFLANVEWNWQMPRHGAFMTRLASFSRLIVMDPRGRGCSDRLSPGEAAALEDKVDDVLAVMAAAASFRATLFGGGQSAFIAMLAAAAHPDRFDGLVLFSATPSWMRSEELPWEDSKEEQRQELDMFRRNTSIQEWATTWSRSFAPSLSDAEIRELGSYSAVSSSVGGGVAELESLNRVDLRDLLPTIRVPTLVLHRTFDPIQPVESGRLLADRIPDAKLVELPGVDSLPWTDEADAVLEQIELFLTGERRAPEPDLALATVLLTDVVDSTARSAALGDRRWREVLEQHDRIVRAELGRARGREIKTMGDGFLATFDGPARAIRCATTIAHAVRALGIEIRAGLHTGEIEIVGDDVGGIAVSIGARVGALAGPSEVLVSQTVKDLVSGSGLEFEDRGEHELKGVPDRWRLYSVSGERD